MTTKLNHNEGYKISNAEGMYFVTFTVVGWIDIFTRQVYKDVIIDSLKYCQKEKGLILHAYVIMSNHLHLIISASNGYMLSDIIRDFKKYTAKAIIKLIKAEPESRRSWMLQQFKQYAGQHSRNKTYQFWQHDNNHYVELESNNFTQQKLDYIHQNPVKAGIVYRAEDYVYSSASNYAGIDAIIDVEFIE